MTRITINFKPEVVFEKPKDPPTRNMEKKPEDFERYGTIMTNFDHSINTDKATEVKNGKCFGIFTGRNFCGSVWFGDEKWKCEVWVYHVHVETVEAFTLEEVMEIVSSKYGGE